MEAKDLSPQKAIEMYKLSSKDSYDELTETQKEVVDLTAKNPDLNQYEIRDKHGDVTRPYVHKVQRCYPHLIRQRREELNGEEIDELDRFAEEVEAPGQEVNANGRMVTERGDVSIVGGIDGRTQNWDERPVKNQLTQEQEDFIDDLSVSELEKRVIRAKARNPNKSYQEIADMIDEKLGTVSAYISMNRDKIEDVHSLKTKSLFEDEPEETFEEDVSEDETDTEDEFSLTFDNDDIVDLLSSNISRWMKKEILEEITSPE